MYLLPFIFIPLLEFLNRSVHTLVNGSKSSRIIFVHSCFTRTSYSYIDQQVPCTAVTGINVTLQVVMTAVDVDPAVYRIAKNYFNLVEDSKLKVVIADGLSLIHI